jgi:thimet oligopeptidase
MGLPRRGAMDKKKTRRMFEAAWVCGALGLALAPSAWSAGPGYDFPRYTTAQQVDEACGRLLTEAKQHEARLQALPDGAVPTLLAEMDAMTRRYEDTAGPMALLSAVHPDKAIRDASEACDLKYQAFSSAFLQNAKVYALLKQGVPADDIDRRYRRDLLDSFEDAGVALPAAKQARAQALSTDITRLSQSFDRRIRESKTRVAFTEAELDGVAPRVWQGAPRDAQGRYLLGLDAPTYEPVIETATVEATRERYWKTFLNQGGTPNLRTLARLGQQRRNYARLFGFGSYADFVLRRRMAGNTAEVGRFLGTVDKAVAQRERRDLQLLRVEKAKHLGLPEAELHRWDVRFYAERVRKARFDVDPEQFRRHFPPEASLGFAFRLAQQLFGVRFEAQPQDLWHADARAYAVYDTADQRRLGTLFVDLYPRDDKYNHAAVWSFRSVSTRVGRTPAAALVVNFNRQGLSLDELETLLHEFGHALHSLLSTTRYASQGGTSTQLDFVEAPSQMLEDWVYDPQVLALFAEVCPACEPVPGPLLAQARRARDFGKGILMARQHLFASYDLALYAKGAPEPQALWRRMESETPLGHVEGTMFPAGFAHIAGGYAAGYYGYLWSLVLAEDLRTAFAAHRLDPAVGRRYRDDVLSQGGQAAPADMLRRFLGREPNSEAFFKSLERE